MRKLLLAISTLIATSSYASAAPQEYFLEHEGQQRRYLLDKPQNSNALNRPLVIALHGGGGHAENAAKMTGFGDIVVPDGGIVAYPQGSGRFEKLNKLKTWNATHCCAYAMKEEIDDIGFISHLIDYLIMTENVDPARVYVTGISNGGMMSHQLGAKLSGKIAAIAPVVGALFGDEAIPDNAPSVLLINGAKDDSIPLHGGSSGGRFASFWDSTPMKPATFQSAFWAKANHCNPKARSSNTDHVVKITYACPEGRSVEHYILENAGHAWPGGERGSRLGDEPDQSFDASRVIWEFFKAHPKP